MDGPNFAMISLIVLSGTFFGELGYNSGTQANELVAVLGFCFGSTLVWLLDRIRQYLADIRFHLLERIIADRKKD